MVKKSARDEEKKPAPKPRASAVELIELRFGFFLNPDQIVSVRVLPQQGDETYAVMPVKTRARRCGSGRKDARKSQRNWVDPDPSQSA